MSRPSIIALVGAAALAAAPVSGALAQDGKSGWYFSGKGGPSFSTVSGMEADGGGTLSSDSGSNAIGAFGMAAGYEWMHRHKLPVRAEFEFMNRTEVTYDASPLVTSGASGALASTVQNITAMAIAYWHLPVGSEAWWPYASTGLGWSHNTVKSQYTPTAGTMVKSKTGSNDLAWSLGAGASVKLGKDVMNDIELRYVDLGRADWGLPAGSNIKTNGFGHFYAVDLVFAIRMVF